MIALAVSTFALVVPPSCSSSQLSVAVARCVPPVMQFGFSLPRWPSPAADTKLEEALVAAARAADAAATLQAFERLEGVAPDLSDLLVSERAALLDGRWVLEATIAGFVGDDDLALTGVSNAVNASGLMIETDGAAKAVQEVSVSAQRIGNEVSVRLPLVGTPLLVRVAGSFKAAADNGRRALVEFDTLDVFSACGQRRLLRAGALFELLRRLKPALSNGADSQSWLETTCARAAPRRAAPTLGHLADLHAASSLARRYISPRIRLGRGNKGSIFVLTRPPDDQPGPLDGERWPM